MGKVVEAIYEKGVLKPLEKLDLKEGERVKIEIRRSVFGILKDWKVDSQKLKDKFRQTGG
ncbi:Protein of unknown function DUF104 [Ferroglobus placidus DSM 10642]|uniref:Antitoxin n=1 Tax=Ferroglobus placidus (strain DSM 10642 / AEDII12DO) TaxID=589924 RepID=D3S0S5_FERPA|nr:antitoxin family protein [Ferroglobus placidus]ADC66316.1 Protein of unknown function DUF104 [Ferroglobus placidus DSM 10642]